MYILKNLILRINIIGLFLNIKKICRRLRENILRIFWIKKYKWYIEILFKNIDLLIKIY